MVHSFRVVYAENSPSRICLLILAKLSKMNKCIKAYAILIEKNSLSFTIYTTLLCDMRQQIAIF